MRRFFVLGIFLSLTGCLFGGRKASVQAPVLSEPDKDLYVKAIRELNRGRYDIARQALSVLIAEYQDSDYALRAKYALADSYYLEGTRSSLSQAETVFKDFVILYEGTELADDAQLKIAMTHVKQMERPDRDPSQAILADRELKTMIEEYSDSPLLDEAKAKRRAVQEVLAEGEYRIGFFYFKNRKAYPASISRYQEILSLYPDYSKTDLVLYGISEAMWRNEQKQESGPFCARVVENYPMSAHVSACKERLKELALPIPEANALAAGRPDVKADDKGVFGSVFGKLKPRAGVPTETGAATAKGNGNKDGLTIEPKVVSPPPPSRR